MSLYLTALSAIVPSLMLLWYFHSRDVFPEPPQVIWTTFILGFLSIVPTLWVALPIATILDERLGALPLVLAFAKALLTAAVPEEAFKLLVLLGYCARHHEFDEPMDGLVYGAAASLGFATLENVLYCADGGALLALTRALTAVPGHAFLGAIMGFYVGQAHFVPSRRPALLVCAFATPTLLHALYNFPLLYLHERQLRGLSSSPTWPVVLAVAVLILTIVFARQLLSLLRDEQLEEQARLQREQPAPSIALRPLSWRRHLTGWFMTSLGGLAATLGGVLTMGLGLTLIVEPTPASDRSFILVGAVLIGVLPLSLGLVVFKLGLQELNRVDHGTSADQHELRQER